MYQNFTVTSLKVDETNHCVVAVFSYDIDKESINKTSVYITESSAEEQPVLDTTYSVDGQVVKIMYPDFKVNIQYTFYATKSVKSITDENLEIEYVRNFSIRSSVDSIALVISPIEYEEITDTLSIKLQEEPGKSGKTYGSFRVQIASDVLFQDLIYDSTSDKSDFVLNKDSIKKSGQYYLRARIERSMFAHGNWSKTSTFTANYQSIQKKEDSDLETSSQESDNEDPIFVNDLNLVAYPENGTTPKSFIFEFDADIDPKSFNQNNVMIIKRRV